MNNQLPVVKVSYTSNQFQPTVKVNSTNKCAEVFRCYFDNDTIEYFENMWLLLLSNSQEVLGGYLLSKGCCTQTVVDMKLLFGILVASGATKFAVAHNHPSGNINPSEQDFQVTDRIHKLAGLHGIEFLDHIILTKDAYYSFADENMLRM